MGVFGWILMGLAEQAPDNKTISPPLIETAFRLPGSGCHLPQSAPHCLKPGVKKRGHGRLIGQTKGGMNP
jgi:hypothetical protein